MILNSRLQITLLSFLFKKFNIIKKGRVEEEFLLYALVCTSFPEKGHNIRLNSREI
jgi:hypothetical protein